jgi:hypothetical protein
MKRDPGARLSRPAETRVEPPGVPGHGGTDASLSPTLPRW